MTTAESGNGMVIGVDFDNTIVGYDQLFHRLAVERGLIPGSVPPRKNEVRDFLRQQGREPDWTELQGYVYGARMAEAQPFPGVLDFFTRGRLQGLPLFIISHKTRIPAAGPAYDLHQTARGWLTAQGFFDPARVGLSPDRVCFGATRQEKISFIRATGCTHFIDDLAETFLEATFPPNVERILFGHRQPPPTLSTVKAMENWSQISEHVFRGGK
jgi:hypothetical protein